MYVCIYICMYICIHMYMYVCMYTYVYVCVCDDICWRRVIIILNFTSPGENCCFAADPGSAGLSEAALAALPPDATEKEVFDKVKQRRVEQGGEKATTFLGNGLVQGNILQESWKGPY